MRTLTSCVFPRPAQDVDVLAVLDFLDIQYPCFRPDTPALCLRSSVTSFEGSGEKRTPNKKILDIKPWRSGRSGKIRECFRPVQDHFRPHPNIFDHFRSVHAITFNHFRLNLVTFDHFQMSFDHFRSLPIDTDLPNGICLGV